MCYVFQKWFWNNLEWRSLEQKRADRRLCLLYEVVYGLVAVPHPDYALAFLDSLTRSRLDKCKPPATLIATDNSPLECSSRISLQPVESWCFQVCSQDFAALNARHD